MDKFLKLVKNDWDTLKGIIKNRPLGSKATKLKGRAACWKIENRFEVQVISDYIGHIKLAISYENNIWAIWYDFYMNIFVFSQSSQFSQFLSIVDFGKLVWCKIFRLGLGSKLNLFGLCGVVFLICESSNGFCVILSRLILGIPVVYKSISKLDQNIIEIVFKIHLGQKPITFTRIWILSGHPIYGYIYKERHKTWNNSKKSI